MTQRQFLHEMEKRSTALRNRVEELIRELTDEQLAWSPPGGGWGIAETLAHLGRTNEEYLDKLTPALAAARASQQQGNELETRHTLAGLMVLTALKPGSKIRLKTPKLFAPQVDDPPMASGRLVDSQRRLEQMMADAENFDLRRIRFANPVSGLLRMNASDAFRILIVHGERHMDQAERVKHHADFPHA